MNSALSNSITLFLLISLSQCFYCLVLVYFLCTTGALQHLVFFLFFYFFSHYQILNTITFLIQRIPKPEQPAQLESHFRTTILVSEQHFKIIHLEHKKNSLNDNRATELVKAVSICDEYIQNSKVSKIRIK